MSWQKVARSAAHPRRIRHRLDQTTNFMLTAARLHRRRESADRALGGNMRRAGIATGILMMAATGTAWSADVPRSINEPPRGPGTELRSTVEPVPNRVVPGWEVGGQIGGGGLGFGLGARAGYTIDRGVYLGGSFTHFWGDTVPTVNGDQRTSRHMLGGDI